MNESVMNNLLWIKYAKYEMYVDLDKESPKAILAFLEERARALDDRGESPTLFLSDFCFDPHIAVTTNNIVRNIAVVYHNHDFVELNYVLRGTVTECKTDFAENIRKNWGDKEAVVVMIRKKD